MELISQASQDSRFEVQNLGETYKSKIIQLQAQLQMKEQKLAAMTENYMNEKNCKITTETQREELQKALSAAQLKLAALENELNAIKSRGSDQSCSSEEEEVLGKGNEVGAVQTSDAVVSGEEDGDLQSRCLASLKEQLQKEQTKSDSLEDKVSELEESLQELLQCKTSLEDSFNCETKWLKGMLQQERDHNIALSDESDKDIEELQKRVNEMEKLNCKLQKYKDLATLKATWVEEGKHAPDDRRAEDQSEISLQNLQSQLEAARAQLALLRFGGKWELEATSSDVMLSAADDSNVTSFPVPSQTESAQSAGTSEETVKDKPKAHGNKRYRVRIAQLIWDGMAKLQTLSD